MISRSLRWKLIISYLAVALLTVLVVTLVIRLTSGQQFYQLVMEQQASLLKEEASYYYAATGSLDGFFEYFRSNPYGEKPPPDGEGGDPPPGGFAREIRGKHGLIDSQYRAVLPYGGYEIGQVIPAELRQNLIAIDVDGETVAWIIPDQSNQMQLSAEESVFLQRSNRAILFASIGGVIGAVAMGIVLAGVFLKPIRSLIDASRRVAAGDLEQQVPIHSQDELGQLSETFNQMSADLSRADRQRKQLTADITHDLSTPLQVIAGYIEMLEDEEVTLTPQRIKIIMDEIELLRRLVGDLTLLTTADAWQLDMQLEEIDLAALLETIQRTYEPIATKGDKTVQIQVAEGTPPLTLDRGRMAQVLGNLVDNAIRYTLSGGVIELRAARVGELVEIRVKDSGIGIHPGDLPYVFDRFYRADPSRSGNAGKMGLGLAIAKALVLAQGGSISVESTGQGEGTTFVLRFPAHPNAPDTAPANRVRTGA